MPTGAVHCAGNARAIGPAFSRSSIAVFLRRKTIVANFVCTGNGRGVHVLKCKIVSKHLTRGTVHIRGYGGMRVGNPLVVDQAN